MHVSSAFNISVVCTSSLARHRETGLALVQIRTEEQGILETRRFAACCWGEGRPATCLVMLDEQGSLGDTLYLPSLSGQQLAKRPSLHYNIAEDPKKVLRLSGFCRPGKERGFSTEYSTAQEDIEMQPASPYVFSESTQKITLSATGKSNVLEPPE